MLTDLVQTIETLQQRIVAHRSHIGDYESRTRVALIDPMLRALGWDVSDPGLVHIEPRTANGWADYALLGGDERPVVFVEAKKLADRDAPIQQTVGYAVTENIQHRSNVRYCASTNGDRWEVYDIIAQESVISVSLSGEKAPKCALKLLGLWRDSLMDGRLDLPIEPVLDTDDDADDDGEEDEEFLNASVEEVRGSLIKVFDEEDTFTLRGRWRRGQWREQLLYEVLLTRDEWSDGEFLIDELNRTANERNYRGRIQPGWVAWRLSAYRYWGWVEF